MPFIKDDFLLTTQAARHLYHEFAEGEPILDYHCHLPPAEIAENRKFENLFEIWLAGDHYKWRGMRANGVSERLCTGEAEPYEKFLAWAETVPHTLRNPLYHWTHLELKRYFGIDDLLSPETAKSVWDRANEMLQTDELRPYGILRKFRVMAVCTTDDPADDLRYHRQIRDSGLPTRVLPTFRPDKALTVDKPAMFNAWVDRLASASNVEISDFQRFLDALRRRHDAFHEIGGRLSDHGIEHCYADFFFTAAAGGIFDRARAGRAANPEEKSQFASFMMLYFGTLNAEKDWTQQLHIGALRNANSQGFQKLGPDTGFDSIGDWSQIRPLGAYLDRLNSENALPKTIVYNLNPADNYAVAAMLGNFQDGETAGKMQLGSGWWFLDQKEAIEWQLNALSSIGLLSRFVGMLTDSRSFLSYPRHEYFRRVLCNVIGKDVENGEIPDNDELLGPMICNICYGNAERYLNLLG